MSQLVVIETHILSDLIKKAVIDGYRMATHSTKVLPTYMSELDAAKYLDLSRSTLRQMRCAGRGPTYSKLGNSIRYKLKDLDAYNDKHKVLTHD